MALRLRFLCDVVAGWLLHGMACIFSQLCTCVFSLSLCCVFVMLYHGFLILGWCCSSGGRLKNWGEVDGWSVYELSACSVWGMFML
jgi:hypothetical protein